jgi:arylsulfatase A-like enzyme
MWQEVLHVPMVFWGADVRSGRDATLVSLVDVAPTVLEAAGIRPAPGIAGRSLWPSLRGSGELEPRNVFAEGNLYGPELKATWRWPYKLVKPRGKGGPARLYDLAQDPHEKQDLAASRPELVEELLGELRMTIKEARTIRKSLRDEAELDEETRERLKSLGYVD